MKFRRMFHKFLKFIISTTKNLVSSLHYNKNVSNASRKCQRRKPIIKLIPVRYQTIREPTKRSSNDSALLIYVYRVYSSLSDWTNSFSRSNRSKNHISPAEPSKGIVERWMEKSSEGIGREKRGLIVSRGRFDSPIELPSRARTLVSCEWSRRWPSSLSSFWRTVVDRSPQARIEAKILV